MRKSNKGIYIIGNDLKFDNSKYPSDRYDRDYIFQKDIYYQLEKC